MSLFDLSQEPLYTKGKDYGKDDLRRSDLQEAWVKLLPPNQRLPTIITFTVTGNEGVIGDESLTLTPDRSGIIHERDILALVFSGVNYAFIVVKSTTSFVANTEFGLPVFPLDQTIIIGSTSKSYLLEPILSINSGGQPKTDATTFTSRNRHAGLTLVRDKGDVETVISIEGHIVGSGRAVSDKSFSDPGLRTIQKASDNTMALFFQSRYAVFDDFGVGYGQGEGRVMVQEFNPSSRDRNDFQLIAVKFEVDGDWSEYLPLGATSGSIDLIIADYGFDFFCDNSSPSLLIPNILGSNVLLFCDNSNLSTYISNILGSNRLTYCDNSSPSTYISNILGPNRLTSCDNSSPSTYITAT